MVIVKIFKKRVKYLKRISITITIEPSDSIVNVNLVATIGVTFEIIQNTTKVKFNFKINF